MKDNTEIIFTAENCEKLKATCKRIILLLDEHIDGALMMAQLMCLADNINEFENNPIVKYK
jgi:hypothetical protein